MISIVGDIQYLFSNEFEMQVIADSLVSNDTIHLVGPSYYSSLSPILTLIVNPRAYKAALAICKDHNNLYLKDSNV